MGETPSSISTEARLFFNLGQCRAASPRTSASVLTYLNTDVPGCAGLSFRCVGPSAEVFDDYSYHTRGLFSIYACSKTCYACLTCQCSEYVHEGVRHRCEHAARML